MRAMNIREKRLINLKRLAAQYHKGKLAAVAERLGARAGYVHHLPVDPRRRLYNHDL